MIEKRRRDRINRCLNELGKTVPMALAKQVTYGTEQVPEAGTRCGRPPPDAGVGDRGGLSGSLPPGPERRSPRPPSPLRSDPRRRAGLRLPAVNPSPLQTSGKLEKAEILEMTVQYLRALHSADFPRGREKGGHGLGRARPGRERATRTRGGGRSQRAQERSGGSCRS